MRLICSILSLFMYCGSPQDIAIQKAHEQAWRIGVYATADPCWQFADLVQQAFGEIGHESWVEDHVITADGGRFVPPKLHRFVVWLEDGVKVSVDSSYPYATKWSQRRISAGILDY